MEGVLCRAIRNKSLLFTGFFFFFLNFITLLPSDRFSFEILKMSVLSNLLDDIYSLRICCVK